MQPTLSIIVATEGRDTLTRALASVTPQLSHGDEILVVCRTDAPKGNATREEAIHRARGTHIMFLDDDDVSTPGALADIRRCVALEPDRVHIFSILLPAKIRRGRVVTPERVVPLEHRVALQKIGGLMCVVPNAPGKLGTWIWPRQLGGDFSFISSTLELRGETDVVFHDEVIAKVQPA